MASHTPVTPSRFGRIISDKMINTQVLPKEIMAEVFPSDKAVNNDEEKILNPLNKKDNAKIRRPSDAIV